MTTDEQSVTKECATMQEHQAHLLRQAHKAGRVSEYVNRFQEAVPSLSESGERHIVTFAEEGPFWVSCSGVGSQGYECPAYRRWNYCQHCLIAFEARERRLASRLTSPEEPDLVDLLRQSLDRVTDPQQAVPTTAQAEAAQSVEAPAATETGASVDDSAQTPLTPEAMTAQPTVQAVDDPHEVDSPGWQANDAVPEPPALPVASAWPDGFRPEIFIDPERAAILERRNRELSDRMKEMESEKHEIEHAGALERAKGKTRHHIDADGWQRIEAIITEWNGLKAERDKVWASLGELHTAEYVEKQLDRIFAKRTAA